MSDISKIQVGETLYDVKDQTARDNFTNAKITTLNNLSDDEHIPTAKATYDYGQTINNIFLNSKVTSLDATSDDEHIPTAKTVYDYIKNNASTGGSSNNSGEDNLARKMLGMTKTTISCFDASNYTNVASLNSLSPWFENFYKKSDISIYIPDGNQASSNGKSLNSEAFGFYLGHPTTPGSSNSTSTTYEGLIKQTYATKDGVRYYEYSNNDTLLAVYLFSSTTVTVNETSYTYPSGLYVYNNITDQSFVYKVEAYYDSGDTIKNTLSRFDSRLITLENNSKTDTTSTLSIDPSEYYTVQTMHVISENLKPENLTSMGMYKISDYTQYDGIYKFTNLNTSKYEYLYSRNLSGLMGLEFNRPDLKVYILQNEDLMIYIFPIDTTIEMPIYDDNNEITGTETINVSSGFYIGSENEAFAYTIQHMREKRNYLIQQQYSIVYDENALMGAYHKVSNNIDYSGLYTALTIYSDENLGMDFQYDCGGYFEPIGINYPKYEGLPVYALNSNSFIYVQGEAPAAIIVPEAFTIPSGAFGNTEEISVTAGTYLPLINGIFGTFELIKLQEKETILDIDALFGDISENGTILETLIAQLSTAETSSTTLTVTQNQLLENISINDLYNTLLTVFQQNGDIKIRVGGQVGTNTTVDMLCPTVLWQIKESNAICLRIGNNIMNSGIWMSCDLQIYSSSTSFNVWSRAAVLN